MHDRPLWGTCKSMLAGYYGSWNIVVFFNVDKDIHNVNLVKQHKRNKFATAVDAEFAAEGPGKHGGSAMAGACGGSGEAGSHRWSADSG